MLACDLDSVAELHNDAESKLDEAEGLLPDDEGKVILSGVDAGVGLGLEDTGGGVTSPVVGGVVGATVTAAVGPPGEVGVLVNNGGDESGEGGIGVVVDDPDLEVGLSVSGHVNVEHGVNGDALVLVDLSDGLAAQKADLLSSVPLELQGKLGDEATGGNDAKGLEDSHGAGAVVISTRGPVGVVGDVNAVEVGTNDDKTSRVVPAMDAGSDALLVIAGVGKLGHGDVSPVGSSLLHASEEPVGGLNSSGALQQEKKHVREEAK